MGQLHAPERHSRELIAVLTQVLALAGDESVAEKALFRRGTVHGDGEDFATTCSRYWSASQRVPWPTTH